MGLFVRLWIGLGAVPALTGGVTSAVGPWVGEVWRMAFPGCGCGGDNRWICLFLCLFLRVISLFLGAWKANVYWGLA